MKNFIGTIFFSFMIIFSAQSATLEATLNRNPVPQGEAFILTLSLKDGQSTTAPDLKPLEKDFNVYSVSNSTQINISNGQRSQTQQWNVGLIATQAGDFTIPQLSAGGISSQPIKVKVLDSTQAIEPQPAGADQKVQKSRPRFTMKGEVNNQEPFVQQQINYTLTIYDTGDLQGEMPQILDDANGAWIIKGIGGPNVQTKNINGQNIREIKFYYALFPQKSGTLKTPEVRFDGFYLTTGQRSSDPFEELFGNSLAVSGFGFADMFATRNPVTLTAKPIEIMVKPIPEQNNGQWWLPAESVELYANWEPQNPQFKVGEAVNRTIQLKATGVFENQLPEIKFMQVAGIKQYPEKPVAENVVKDGKIVAIKKMSAAYIPSQAGNITLPEITLPWYNVNTNQMEKATLPAITIKVANNDNAVVAASQPIATTPEKELNTPNQNMEQVATDIAQLAKAETAPNSLLYLFVLVAFVLGIGFSYLVFRPKKVDTTENKPAIRNHRTYIHTLAQEQDFRALRDAIIQWASKKNPQVVVTSLKAVETLYPHTEFGQVLEKLTAELYAKNHVSWDAAAFNKAFDKVYKLKSTATNPSPEPLPKLYK